MKKSNTVEFVTVCNADEIQPGLREVFGINDKWIAVFNVGGKYFAIEDLCPHDEGPVAEGKLDGYEIECPRHGARFDIRNGKVLTAPALVDVPWYEVRVKDGQIQVAV